MQNPLERELAISEYWKENKINQKVREKNKDGKNFYFLDGPPYVTGDLHPGQMWVKTVKDIFLRYKRYRGFNVRDRAGYDVHGLPIENKVEKLLNINSKKEIEHTIGIESFVKKCREYVDSFMGRMDKDYNRFGMSLDFSDPYLAYRSEYIETAWEMFKKIDDRGYLYKGKKTTAFCTRCETALAQGSMEVVYGDAEDPSIYVAFKVDSKASKAKTDLGDNTSLLIWTTTPWTLPANVAVAAHPKELYVLASTGDADFIIAKPRLDSVANAIGKSVIVKKEFYGSELEGLRYISPLEAKVPMQKDLRKYHRIVLNEELVSMEEGTGLVHMAPGHGLEDYQIGKANGLPIVSPVTPGGFYTEEAGAYNGIRVPKEANDIVLKDLDSLGVVFGKGTIKHSYPQCWRCDTKLIYIATEQWFFNIQKVKNRLLRENAKVIWHPAEAAGWQNDVLKATPDWCISRQRYWGIPMPIWVCGNCHAQTIVSSLAELKAKSIDKALVDSLQDLHRPYIDRVVLICEKCGHQMKRLVDVIDVWFDASIGFRASMTMEQFDKMFPIEYILEGKDQLRGWFSYLLKTSVMVYGKKPYRHIGIDGMLLDEHGREMHKKLGNYIGLDELAKTVGADTFRLWCAEHTPWLDLLFNKQELKDAGKAVLIIYNISNLLQEYEDALAYRPTNKSRISLAGLGEEDLWILSRLESTLDAATRALDDYRAFDATAAIKSFLVSDFSRFYLKLAKKRILYEKKSKAKKIINVINYVLYKTLVMISPMTPFVAEAVYMDRYKDQESIFLESWPKVNMKLINADLEKQMSIAQDAMTAILNSREKSDISLRWPVAKATLEVTGDEAYGAIERLVGIVADYSNAKEIELKRSSGAKEELRPVFAKLGPSFKEKAQAVAEALKTAKPFEVQQAIATHGHYSLHTSKGTVDIHPEHFTVVQSLEEGEAAMFRYGRAYVDKNVSEELKEEALVREFERRIQLIRKELGLKKVDRIALGYECVEEVAAVLSKNSKKISKDLNAAAIHRKVEHGIAPREFDLEGALVKVSVKREER